MASSGKSTSIISGFYYKEFTSFSQLKEAQISAGFDIKAVERFQNGYAFSNMYVSDAKELDENGNTIAQYKEISSDYKKTGWD